MATSEEYASAAAMLGRGHVEERTLRTLDYMVNKKRRKGGSAKETNVGTLKSQLLKKRGGVVPARAVRAEESRKIGGRTEPTTMDVGLALRDAGDFNEASKVFHRLTTCRAKDLGPMHPLTRSTKAELTKALDGLHNSMKSQVVPETVRVEEEEVVVNDDEPAWELARAALLLERAQRNEARRIAKEEMVVPAAYFLPASPSRRRRRRRGHPTSSASTLPRRSGPPRIWSFEVDDHPVHTAEHAITKAKVALESMENLLLFASNRSHSNNPGGCGWRPPNPTVFDSPAHRRRRSPWRKSQKSS